MAGLENRLKIGSNEMELVDFRISRIVEDGVYEGIYGVNVSKVKEIIRMPKLTEVPGVAEFIDGIFDLRGIVIPVVNLAKWMKIEEPDNIGEDKRVIIAEFNNTKIGFIVHEARRIRRINWKDIEPATFATGVGSMDKSQLTGVTQIENDHVLLILDLESVVMDLGLYVPPPVTYDESRKDFDGIVLLLDDSKTARSIMKETLTNMGFDVVEASDGQNGIEKLEELSAQLGSELHNRLKLIVSDVEMPRMDGFHFASIVKADARFSPTPIIFNSSISDSQSSSRGQEAGGESYMVKFNPDTFYKEVSRVLHSSKEGK